MDSPMVVVKDLARAHEVSSLGLCTYLVLIHLEVCSHLWTLNDLTLKKGYCNLEYNSCGDNNEIFLTKGETTMVGAIIGS